MNIGESHFLFVYSSLLRGFKTPEYDYVSKYFDFVGNARTRGILSDAGDMLVGSPVNDDRFIYGELYKVRQPDMFAFAIGQLDDYEGIHPAEGEPPASYVRASTSVILPGGKMVDSWVYWYSGSVDGLPVVESGNVMDYLRQKGLL